MVNYFEVTASLVRSRSSKRKERGFENKLAQQENSVLNQTFTLDTNKAERLREFRIEDAINGFLPRARSSGPRHNMLHQTNSQGEENVRRVRSETTSLFSTTCKLPSLDQKACLEKKTCTIRPWSRTQDELRKFKETLSNSAASSAKIEQNPVKNN